MRYSIIRRIQYILTVIGLALSLVMPLSCFRPRKVVQYIEPLGLFFQIQRKDTTVMISFGEKRVAAYPNYYEKNENSECSSSPCYFVVDNTSGTPKIRHIFFEPMIFFDIHIQDYPYSIAKDSLITDKAAFVDYVNGCSKIESNVSIADYPNYYVVKVQPAPYDKRLDYWIHDLGEIDDLYAFIDHFEKTPNYLSFSELKEYGFPLGYRENVSAYGEPKESARITVSQTNRKDMIRGGWLFLDTMDIRLQPVLENNRWIVDGRVLSIIYRIDADGDRIPVNGVRYDRWMDIQGWCVYYQ